MTRSGIKRLGPVHWQAMALRLQGLTYREISAHVHRSVSTVEHWFRHDDTFRAAYDALQEEQVARTLAMLYEAGPQAARRLIGLLDHPTGIVALGAAKDLLDRIGLKPTERREVMGVDGGPILIRWESGDVADLG